MMKAPSVKLRVKFKPVKELLLRFRGKNEPDLSDMESKGRLDLINVAKAYGFLKENAGMLSLTPRGDELLSAHERFNGEGARTVLREALKNDFDFRFHWAWVCDNRDEFKTADLAKVFRKIGYSDLKDSSLLQYIRNFTNWAMSAGLCVKSGGNYYKILKRMVIGIGEEGLQIAEKSTTVTFTSEDTEELARLSLLTLNAHVCDYLADESHQSDLGLIERELESLRDFGVLDDFAVNMLEREIRVAMESKSYVALAMVAQSLRDLRKEYLS